MLLSNLCGSERKQSVEDMINDSFNHAAVMHALIQPQGPVMTNSRHHITCLCIKSKDDDDRDFYKSDFVYKNKSMLRLIAKRLRDRYGTPDIDNSCANFSISIQKDNKQFSQMAISTSNAKDHPSAEEVDEKLVEFLKNKDQDNSKTVMLESSMNFILDKLQSNFENDSGYGFTFLCGSEYFGQNMNDTQLSSLSFKNTCMTSDWLYNFAKHLPRSQITSLVLPKIIVDPRTSARKYQKEDSSFTDSSRDDVEHRTKKPKITADDTCNEIVLKNGLEYLASILKDTKISYLDFGGNPLNIKMLSCSLVGSKVTSLSLRACKLQNDGLGFLARILKDTPINSIDLSENELNCQSLNIFVEGLEGTNITSLNLSSNKIGVDGMNCLANVLKNTSMTSLDISDNNLNYQSLQVFLNGLVHTKITYLSLKNNDIGADGLMCLGRVLKNTQITSLDVSGIEWGDESMSMFAPCLLDSKIEFLGLQSNKLVIDEMDILLNVIGNTQITSIDLYDNLWDLEDKNSDGINQLDRLLTNPQITSINIGLNHSRFDQFASSLIGSNVTHLGLKELDLSIDDLICLGNVLKNSKISSVDLSNNNLGDEDFEIFVPYLVDSEITSLNLSGNIPCHDGITYLSRVLKNTKIISLNLSDCCMRCNDVRHFVMYLPDSKIKSLDLSGNIICCNSFYLAFILKHTQITTLDISSQKFNVDPVYFLREFKSSRRKFFLSHFTSCNLMWYILARNLRNTEINSLYFTYGEIDSEDLKYLSQGLVNSQVVILDLNSNFIDSSGVYYLAEVLKHTRISSLILENNRIEDEGFKYLMKGLGGSQLKLLNLSKNCINDDGIQGLAESLASTQLVDFDLRDNTISSSAAYNLSENVEKSNLHSMFIQIDFNIDIGVHVGLYLFKYQNCFIEINESLLTKRIADFVKEVYKKNGIVQLILEGDEFSHLAGAFDNMDINETVIRARYLYVDGRESKAISCLEKSNIGELEIDWCHLSPKSFEKMQVIALKLRFDPVCGPDCKNLQLSRLKSSLTKSNIVYLDFSDEIVDIELIDVLSGSEIFSLDLRHTFISQMFIESLAKALPATNISYINLDSNFIGFQGLKCLMNGVSNSKLSWLSLEKNKIEKELVEDIQLSPFIVPRTDNPIEFQIRYLFKELVTWNSSTEQFEFIVPCDDSRATIIHYPRLIKFLLDRPIHKMHIYDYFYMQNKRHSLHLLNSINVFVEQMKPNFLSFFDSNLMQLEKMFGYDSFVSLVRECNSSNLTEFVEFLLLHRVLYYVDDEKNFLHPFIYKMLHEHQMPIYIEKIEPNKKQQIISYFEKHLDFDGAQEIINLLKI